MRRAMLAIAIVLSVVAHVLAAEHPLLVSPAWLAERLGRADVRIVEYEAEGITPDKTVVTCCQTHHRAAHSHFVLRLLGYPRVVAYTGSWAEWGDRADLPVQR